MPLWSGSCLGVFQLCYKYPDVENSEAPTRAVCCKCRDICWTTWPLQPLNMALNLKHGVILEWCWRWLNRVGVGGRRCVCSAISGRSAVSIRLLTRWLHSAYIMTRRLQLRHSFLYLHVPSPKSLALPYFQPGYRWPKNDCKGSYM